MHAVNPDKALVARRFARSLPTYDRSAVVQREMANELATELRRLAGATGFDRALDLGCGTGLLTERLLAACRVRELYLNDLVPACAATAAACQARHPETRVRFLAGDMETAALPDQLDLVAANAALQWAGNLPTFLAGLCARLRPGGWLALGTFGPANLREITRITGQTLPYWSVQEWRAALAASCEVLVARERMRTLTFPDLRALLRHLQETGVNALATRPWTPREVAAFGRDYAAACGHNGELPLTYHPLVIVARLRGAALPYPTRGAP